MIRWTKESISYDTDPLASEYEHIIYILAWEETAKEEGALNKLHTSAPPPSLPRMQDRFCQHATELNDDKSYLAGTEVCHHCTTLYIDLQ